VTLGTGTKIQFLRSVPLAGGYSAGPASCFSPLSEGLSIRALPT